MCDCKEFFLNIDAELSVFNSLSIQAKEAAGNILWIEFKIRFLSERSKKIQEELKNIWRKKGESREQSFDKKIKTIMDEVSIQLKDRIGENDLKTLEDILLDSKIKKAGKKKDNDELGYWNCDLDDLLYAIKISYASELKKEEVNLLEKFQMLRNRYLHANFVKSLECLNLSKGGRYIEKGKRVSLKYREVGESIKALFNNNAINEIRKVTFSAEEILDKVIRSV